MCCGKPARWRSGPVRQNPPADVIDVRMLIESPLQLLDPVRRHSHVVVRERDDWGAGKPDPGIPAI